MAKRPLCEKLLRGHIPDLGRAALIASGLRDAGTIGRYLRWLDAWLKGVRFSLSVAEPEAQARRIFQELWREKPERYQLGGSFRLTEVIDAQLGEGLGPVGNCLGLTLIYNCLLERWGIAAQAVYLPNAFGRGPHVFSLLATPQGPIDVENIFPHGFGYSGHRGVAGRITWDNQELIAEVFAAQGNELFEGRRLGEAVERYKTAIRLNPRYPSAHFNLGMALSELGRHAEAEEAFERAASL